MKLVIGLDGQSTGEKALEFAKNMAASMKSCELIVVYVIEWSPFSFQTAEENAQRHKRREEEIAKERKLAEIRDAMIEAGLSVDDLVSDQPKRRGRPPKNKSAQ